MICPFGSYWHAGCGEHSECQRNDAHHHHLSPAHVEVISPGTDVGCWDSYIGRNKK